jgi:hypothetical protein
LQDDSYSLDFAVNLTNFEVGGGERLYDCAKPFQDYDLTVPVDDGASMRVQFRLDRQGDPNVLIYDMLKIIGDAIASEKIKFVRLRK